MLKDGLTSEEYQAGAVRSNLDLPTKGGDAAASAARLSSEGVTCKYIPGDVTVSRDELWEVRRAAHFALKMAMDKLDGDYESRGIVRECIGKVSRKIERICGNASVYESYAWQRVNESKAAADPA
jgi:hypothetical protein